MNVTREDDLRLPNGASFSLDDEAHSWGPASDKDHGEVFRNEEGDAPLQPETEQQKKLDALRSLVCRVLMPQEQSLRPYMDLCSNGAFENWSQATVGFETLSAPCGRQAGRRCAQSIGQAQNFHNFGGWGPGADAAVTACQESAWESACLGATKFDLDPQDGELFNARVFGADPHACFCACLGNCQNAGALFGVRLAEGAKPRKCTSVAMRSGRCEAVAAPKKGAGA